MRTVAKVLAVLVVLLASVTSPSVAQQLAPPVSACATPPELSGPVNDWIQQLFSDPSYAGARAQDSLQTLSPTEPVAVWSATGPDCRNLVKDAVNAINSEFQTAIDWRDVEYLTAAIGPYLLVIDLGWGGDLRPIVVFNESDGSLHGIILSG